MKMQDSMGSQLNLDDEVVIRGKITSIDQFHGGHCTVTVRIDSSDPAYQPSVSCRSACMTKAGVNARATTSPTEASAADPLEKPPDAAA